MAFPLLNKFLRRKRAASGLEYSVLIGLVTLGSLGAVSVAGTEIRELFYKSSPVAVSSPDQGSSPGPGPSPGASPENPPTTQPDPTIPPGPTTPLPGGQGAGAPSLSWGGMPMFAALVDQNHTEIFSLTNTGKAATQAFSEDQFSISGEGFSISNNSCTTVLAPSESCAITISFMPKVYGESIGEVSVHNGSLQEPYMMQGQAWALAQWPAAAALPVAIMGEAYANPVPPAQTPDQQTFTYALENAAAQNGLTFNPQTFQVEGTPVTTGETSSFKLTATSEHGSVVSKTFTVVAKASLEWNVATALPDAAQGMSYSYTFPEAVSAKNTPITYSFVSGTLPPNVTFNPTTRTLSGTPSTINSYSFSYRATAGGTSVVKNFTLKTTEPMGWNTSGAFTLSNGGRTATNTAAGDLRGRVSKPFQEKAGFTNSPYFEIAYTDRAQLHRLGIVLTGSNWGLQVDALNNRFMVGITYTSFAPSSMPNAGVIGFGYNKSNGMGIITLNGAVWHTAKFTGYNATDTALPMVSMIGANPNASLTLNTRAAHIQNLPSGLTAWE